MVDPDLHSLNETLLALMKPSSMMEFNRELLPTDVNTSGHNPSEDEDGDSSASASAWAREDIERYFNSLSTKTVSFVIAGAPLDIDDHDSGNPEKRP